MNPHSALRWTRPRSLAALGTRPAERVPRARGRAAIILLILLAAGCSAGNGGGTDPAAGGPAVDVPAAPPPARFIRQIEWAQRGQWLKADTHIHTKFSDGSFNVDEVADQAVRFGCDVMAITDHGDRDLRAATPEYMAAIRAARRRHPELILLAGIEWNMPPWGGREHVVVLVPPQPGEEQILAHFKTRFDDYLRETHDPALAEEGLRWLSQQTFAGLGALLAIHEHPSRKRKEVAELPAEFRRLRAVSDRLVAMAGAPGHQRSSRVGDYRGPLQPVDRWDPAVAEVGGAWDVLLQEGLDVWAAYAVSDFHSEAGYDFGTGLLWLGCGLLVLAALAFARAIVTGRGRAKRHPAEILVAGSVDNPAPQRHHFAILSVVFMFLAVYGSLIPLRFSELSMEEALQRFREIPFLSLGVQHRADWVANMLLFMPIGFFSLGAMTLDVRGVLYKLWSLVFAAVPCLVLSMGIEFAQLWFPPRTVSQNDIAAEVRSLGWFHPEGTAYTPSLFTVAGRRYVMGAGKRSRQPFTWIVYDLQTQSSQAAPLSFDGLASKPGLLYGSNVRDRRDRFYLGGVAADRPVLLRADRPRPSLPAGPPSAEAGKMAAKVERQDMPAVVAGAPDAERLRTAILQGTADTWLAASEADKQGIANLIASWFHAQEPETVRQQWARRYYEELQALSSRPGAGAGRLADWLPVLHALMLHAPDQRSPDLP